MLIVPEREIANLITAADCFTAVERVFASMANKAAYNFPVIREAIGHADALYGFKSGFDRESLALGLKAGGFWPNNVSKGLTNHQSTIFLFDADTGKCRAAVGGNLITALRTAAASAVSIKYLARQEAKVLGMIGAGHQSAFQLRAALQQRQFEKVVAWNFHPEMLSRLEQVANDEGLPFEVLDLERLGAESDVIISITSSFAPLLKASQVRPGTHVACMGTDTKGKQEVEPELVAMATVFTDEIAQAVTIGECQHAVERGITNKEAIIEIGAVISGKHPGRSSADEITLFDGTGIALQDLAVASVAVELALVKGVAIEIDF
ncbi:iminosuccinate reductase BhcD [Allorhizobium taibaishanense]|uniref:Ornithine cyclodeaminase n=1 Tax=Allorhizobium taibaishanense TaxID=887144 RepID=A0A1Q9A0K7_9HYPH|nr:iminosuccinate reductase BhcD [Allorhizobium taibaishanense]MBB4010484.1 ornithine cyclodeaminase [Allorhizobium taibaishanense]OLP47973.1 ornithine cyclodeaminase [Allorhizobium taibaishanense]